MTYHRPIHSRDHKPPVDVIGLATAITRAPNRWGVLASVREIEAMAEALQALWQVTIAAGRFELALEHFDRSAPGCSEETQQIEKLNQAREQLRGALQIITDYQEQPSQEEK